MRSDPSDGRQVSFSVWRLEPLPVACPRRFSVDRSVDGAMEKGRTSECGYHHDVPRLKSLRDAGPQVWHLLGMTFSAEQMRNAGTAAESTRQVLSNYSTRYLAPPLHCTAS